MDEKLLDAALEQYLKLGRADDDSKILDARLHAAVEAAAASSGLHPQDLGVADWAADTVKKIKRAAHAELCDEKNGTVNAKYLQLLEKGTSKDAISGLASSITPVFASLNLAPLAVSAVVLYLAMWILKTGLKSWCSAHPAQ
jgi:hypothetical protein